MAESTMLHSLDALWDIVTNRTGVRRAETTVIAPALGDAELSTDAALAAAFVLAVHCYRLTVSHSAAFRAFVRHRYGPEVRPDSSDSDS